MSRDHQDENFELQEYGDDGDESSRQILTHEDEENGTAGLNTAGSGSSTPNRVDGSSFWRRAYLLTCGEVVQPDIKAPKLPFYRLFWLFFLFGCRAFGGPVAQINMMKQQLVVEEQWITVERFNRVLAVYQALPGPEATELACYFGLLSRGRLGAVLAGLAFLLPGFSLLLLISWVYVTYYEVIQNPAVTAIFSGIQPAVSAMIFRALVKLAEHAFQDQRSNTFSMLLAFYGLLSFLLSVLKINFFITMGLCGVIHSLLYKQTLWRQTMAFTILISFFVGFVVYVVYNGFPTDLSLGSGLTLEASLLGIFLLGLLGGLLTFGGAYTTIPFIYADAVISAGWLTEKQFLDAIAITNVLPTPLVMFVTMVGFIGDQSNGGSGFGGAALMTLGIFLPAFSFTLIGHNFFEKVVDSAIVAPFLDGITASVIGIVLVTAFEFAKATLRTPLSLLIFFLSFAALWHFKHKFTSPIVIIVAGIASQILFVDQ